MAKDIEALVAWVYCDQVADNAHNPRQSGGGFQQFVALGTLVDGGGVSGKLHPDPNLIDALVDQLGRRRAAILREFGRTARRPDWLPAWRATVSPVWDNSRAYKRPRHVVERDKRGHAILCPIRFSHDPELVAMRRGQYVDWHAGLLELRGRLEYHGGLEAVRPTGPRALGRPWLSEGRRFMVDTRRAKP